ncbi:unnamed protein product [Acanthoscelides obtectus]|uniref:Uncharacterized protein n=1 Tax=Acanthoscelides obtectus TaxID=200917 RepID=A0A9P0P580_ACAOB|nr:unnamed protein product [Acanthoscelides obtectus]CAK1633228.1 hypothetical protein AOBTE_LOCUS7996 [Acanthoscelides obtectus]
MSFFQSKSCFPTKFDIELNISSDVVAAAKIGSTKSLPV